MIVAKTNLNYSRNDLDLGIRMDYECVRFVLTYISFEVSHWIQSELEQKISGDASQMVTEYLFKLEDWPVCCFFHSVCIWW